MAMFDCDIEKIFEDLGQWCQETQERVEALEGKVLHLQRDTKRARHAHVATRDGDTPAARCNAFAKAEETLRLREAVREDERSDYQVLREAVASQAQFDEAAARTRAEQEAKRRRSDDS